MIAYTVKFLDYWHLSSGLSGGARLDSMVVKDQDDLPYIPGKTIKGLVREILEREGEEVEFLHECYFANATIEKSIKEEIVTNKLQDNLYDIIASTRIEQSGIAKDNSLREIEVVIPIELEGEVRHVPDQKKERLKKALQKIKRMGLNRNRGLGRCRFEIKGGRA